jgi:ribosomal subunit interface protein
MEVTEALRNHVTKHAEKLSRIGKKVIAVRVFLETVAKKSNDPHANHVTFRVMVPGKDVVVQKKAVDMYEAVVQAAHAAIRHVRKVAERRITKTRHDHGAAAVLTS